jgi:hypothetical protein
MDTGFVGHESYTMFGAFSQEHKIRHESEYLLKLENCKLKKRSQIPSTSQTPEK